MRIGFLVFDQVTQLDLTGPLQVFSQAPGYECHLVAGDLAPRPSDGPLALTPTTTFQTAPALDMVCVPGGYGVAAAMDDGAARQRLIAGPGDQLSLGHLGVYRRLHFGGGRPVEGSESHHPLGLS